MRGRRGPHRRRQRRADEHEGVDRADLGEPQGEQAAHAVADDDRGAVERVVPRDRVVDVRLEVELLERRGLRPEVGAQVERVPLPAALREVAQVALPQPRAAQLAVQVVLRPASRPALRQP